MHDPTTGESSDTLGRSIAGQAAAARRAELAENSPIALSIAAIEQRIAEHDGHLTEDEESYVAGLRDALALVRSFNVS